VIDAPFPLWKWDYNHDERFLRENSRSMERSGASESSKDGRGNHINFEKRKRDCFKRNYRKDVIRLSLKGDGLINIKKTYKKKLPAAKRPNNSF